MLKLVAATLVGMAMSSAEPVATRSDRLRRGEAMLGKKRAKKASATIMIRFWRIDAMLNRYAREKEGLGIL